MEENPADPGLSSGALAPSAGCVAHDPAFLGPPLRHRARGPHRRPAPALDPAGRGGGRDDVPADVRRAGPGRGGPRGEGSGRNPESGGSEGGCRGSAGAGRGSSAAVTRARPTVSGRHPQGVPGPRPRRRTPRRSGGVGPVGRGRRASAVLACLHDPAPPPPGARTPPPPRARSSSPACRANSTACRWRCSPRRSTGSAPRPWSCGRRPAPRRACPLARHVAAMRWGVKGARRHPLVVLGGPGWHGHPASGTVRPVSLGEAVEALSGLHGRAGRPV